MLVSYAPAASTNTFCTGADTFDFLLKVTDDVRGHVHGENGPGIFRSWCEDR